MVADVFATRTVAKLAERLHAAETDPGRLEAVAEIYLEVTRLDPAEVSDALAGDTGPESRSGGPGVDVPASMS